MYCYSLRVLRIAGIHGGQLYVEKTEARHIEKHTNGTGERWHRGHKTVRWKSTLVAGYTSQRGNGSSTNSCWSNTLYVYQSIIKMVDVIWGAVHFATPTTIILQYTSRSLRNTCYFLNALIILAVNFIILFTF